MKLFGPVKMWMPMLGLGAVLLFAPQCRAQAEIAPDHFDGGDDWEIALAHRTPHLNARQSMQTLEAKNQTPAAQAKPTVSAKNRDAAQKPALVAVRDKSKLLPRKPEDK